ncbi:MAG TPA: hypothetical protein ENJ08_17535 [Gammaproteobacteria bacterium]|nr:hypothetical protein [Gammaproteobacteria bacterium]
MSTNLQAIHEILEKQDLDHKVLADKGYIILGMATKVYTNIDNDQGISIIIAVEEGGDFIKFIAPNLYTSKNKAYKLAVLETCMYVMQHVKMIQCLLDDSDGDLSFQIHIPVEDNQLSEKQLMRALFCITETVDTFDSAFRSAIKAGEVTVSKVMDEHKKKARLAQLIKDTPVDLLDQLIHHLEFINSNSLSTDVQTATH